ncbi:squalene/oxidosqualene cyclase-like protein [Scopulibacillus darangshiensis]|uniref:Squalene/oxidosqualene cyclase-like protein n=1 Tax=Scopulibacillus darangshiensis TaxID=442528 RepID=A0A4R2NL94_9BACL|nr:prenyltransferase/squalene oxidase repeat-containing protein [Scopulibacillus darangshiensis]TCP21954.1 squalene/oxidosqualene cyclase-like protein [Scopulibacillus darangshiensis]
MIYALLALGYNPNSHWIENAVKGMTSFLSKVDDNVHLQNSLSTIWDTALISYAMQEAGCQKNDHAVLSSAEYLLSVKEKQRHSKGGWAFSESSTSPLDIDDTQAALRAIHPYAVNEKWYRKAWNEGVNWLIDIQNNDGGWGAFEKNRHQSLFTLLPIRNLKDTVIDPSTADLTGRTLEFLGSKAQMTLTHQSIRDGVSWILKNQETDGSWYGRWGVSYIYGTWAALTGLTAVGVSPNHSAIQRALSWLKHIQQTEGGWGESCKSDQERTYTPLLYPTVVQTSWALDALIACHHHPTEEIDRGIDYLLSRGTNHSSKAVTYPMGAGLPGHFYIHYHSYQHIWPLLALSHYMKKYQ